MLVKTDRAFVLRMTRVDWQAMLSAVLRDPAVRFAQGDIAGMASSQSTLLCARGLVLSADIPTGESRADLAAWCVVVFVDRFGQPPVPGMLRRQLQPRHAQQLTVLCLDTRTPSSGWVGWVMERGDIRPLDGLQIMGTSPIFSYRGSRGEEIDPSNDDPQRYSRLQPVLGSSYSAVRRSTVLLVGASRSGSLACMELAALGIDRLIIADRDVVELHNLDGMFWATPDDIGRPKALVNAERLSRFRPEMAIHPLAMSIRDPHLRLPALCDLLVTCVDDEIARRHAAAGLAARWLLPHLDIATQVLATAARAGGRELKADVRFVIPGEGCLICQGGENAGQADEIEDFERFAPPGSLSPAQLRPWNQQRLGSLITVNAMAVSIGIQTWLQFLAGELTGSIWHRLTWSDPTHLGVESGYVRGRTTRQCCNR